MSCRLALLRFGTATGTGSSRRGLLQTLLTHGQVASLSTVPAASWTRSLQLLHQQLRPITISHSLRDSFNVQDEQDFKDKVTSVTSKAIVVEFHATWCGPCKQLMPRLEKKIATTQNKVDLAKVDIDDLPDIAMEYGVSAVPSVIAFIDGKIVDKFVGSKDEDEIDAFVNKLAK